MKRECCDFCFNVLGSEQCYVFVPNGNGRGLRHIHGFGADIDFTNSRNKPESGTVTVSLCVSMTTSTSERVLMCANCFYKKFNEALSILPTVNLIKHVPTVVAEPDC